MAKAPISAGAGLASGLLGLLGLAAPSLIEGVQGSLKKAQTLEDLLDNPELLKAKFDEQTRRGEFDALLQQERLKKMAAIASSDPKMADMLRALQMGNPQPRLTSSEVRIGGHNDTEAIDKRIAQTDLMDNF